MAKLCPACRVRYAAALPKIEIVREVEAAPLERFVFRSSADVAVFLQPRIGGFEQEIFCALFLDAKHRLKPDGFRIVSVGSLTASIVHPREVFRPAVFEGAVAVIVAHQHPSGLSEPSPEDIEITRRLRQAGEILGIRVLDHVIIGGESHFSFADAGQF